MEPHNPFSTMSSTRSPITWVCGGSRPRSTPSMTSMDRPCTADQAKYSAAGRRCGGSTSACTSPVERHAEQLERIQTAAAGHLGIGFAAPVASRPERRAEQSGLGQRETQIAGADRAQADTGEISRIALVT